MEIVDFDHVFAKKEFLESMDCLVSASPHFSLAQGNPHGPHYCEQATSRISHGYTIKRLRQFSFSS